MDAWKLHNSIYTSASDHSTPALQNPRVTEKLKMIPVNFRRKMGVYSLNLNGLTVHAKVVDNEELLREGLEELRNKLDPRFPIVGFDWKCTIESVGENQNSCLKLLVFYVKNRCLLVKLGRIASFQDSLHSFLSDEKICFLSLQETQELRLSKLPMGVSLSYPSLKTGVSIGTFAANALKNPELIECTNLVELATKAGFPLQEQASECPVPDWDALVFTQEDVKYALKDAYVYYNIGVKLMSQL